MTDTGGKPTRRMRARDPRVGLSAIVAAVIDALASGDPRSAALEFLHSAFNHACVVCDWDPALAATAEGRPPPVV